MDIKENIKTYFALDSEINESSKLLRQLSKKRKETGDEILEWMRQNNKVRIKTRHGALERSITTRKVNVSAARVQEVAKNFVGDDERAAELARLVYEDRPVEEREILKTNKKDAGPAGETVDM